MWFSTGFRKPGMLVSGTGDLYAEYSGVSWDYPEDGLLIEQIPCHNSGLYALIFAAAAIEDGDTKLKIEAHTNNDTARLSRLRSVPGTDFFLFEGPAGSHEVILSCRNSSGDILERSFPLTIHTRMLTGNTEACEDTIHASLGENCQTKAFYNFVSASPVDCRLPSDFEVLVNDGNLSNGDTIDGPGLWTFLIRYAVDWDGFAGPLDKERMAMRNDKGVSFSFSPDGKNAVATLKPGFFAATHAWSAAFDQSADFSIEWDTAGRVEVQGLVFHPDGSTDTLPVDTVSGGGSLSGIFAAGDRLVMVARLTSAASQIQWNNIALQYTGKSSINRNEILCKGVVRAEDNTLPQISCPDTLVSSGIRKDTLQVLSGLLRQSSARLPEETADCLPYIKAHPGIRWYDRKVIQPQFSGYYEFVLRSGLTAGYAGMVFYAGAFDPGNPCLNIMGQYLSSETPDPFLRFWLEAGKVYTVAVLANEPEAGGWFRLEVKPPFGGQLYGVGTSVEELQLVLYCGDLPAVFRRRSSFDVVEMPVFSDNCGIADTFFTDEIIDAGDCGDFFIRRTFRVSDESGNYNSCSYDIRFTNPKLVDLILPPPVFTVACGLDYPADEKGFVLPSYSGYPFLETLAGSLPLDGEYCNLAAAWKDEGKLAHCGNSFSFLRTWTLLDWCRPATAATFLQVIRVGDYSPPNFEDFPEGDTLIFSAANGDCTASFLLPLPKLADACSDWELNAEVLAYWEQKVRNGFGEAVATVTDTLVLMQFPEGSKRHFVSGLAPGVYGLRYRASDACGNKAEKIVPVKVLDREAPQTNCVDRLTIGLGNGGEAPLFASDVDEGSRDFCSSIQLQLSREPDREWSDVVYFDCTDLGRVVEVYLKATDAGGNESTCRVEVSVEDKSLPRCFAPKDKRLNSLDLPLGIDLTDTIQLQDLFGIPSGEDNCSFSWREKAPQLELDACGSGTVRRFFEVFDELGNKNAGLCEQVIEIIPGHNYAIRFPADIAYDCSNAGMPDSLYAVDYKGCDLISVHSSDKYSFSSDEQCYLIFRTFEVVNWCEFDGLGNPMVISRDEDCNGIPGEEAVWLIRQPDLIFTDRDGDPYNGTPAAAEKKQACHESPDERGFWRRLDLKSSNGYWSYTQIIQVSDNHAPEISFLNPDPVCVYQSSDCMTEIDYLVLILDNCTPDGLDVTVVFDAFSDGIADRELPLLDTTGVGIVSGEYPKYRIRDRMPAGRHTYSITARDACGNSSRKSLTFDVIDCAGPEIACIGGLVAELSPAPPGDFNRGYSVINLEDVLIGARSDCSDIKGYSINRAGEKPDRESTSVVLTCEDIPAVTLELYAWDDAQNPNAPQPDGTKGGANYSVCETVIFVQDNLNSLCNSNDLKGSIAREDGRAVSGVQVFLNGNAGLSTMSDEEGTYGFRFLSPSYDYTLLPALDGDPVAGVTTFDLLKITDHILGQQSLGSPYQLIAADADNSGSITALDVILLRQLILRKITVLPNNSSWRFVDADYVFKYPDAPWRENFPGLININSRDEGMRDSYDFVAIKIGDVVDSRQLRNTFTEDPDFASSQLSASVSDQEYRIFHAYPNPVQDRLHLPIALAATADVWVEVHTQSGQLVFSRKYTLEGGRQEILLEDIFAGTGEAVFFVTVKLPQVIRVQKILYFSL